MKKRIVTAVSCFLLAILLLVGFTVIVKSDAQTMTVAVITAPVPKGTQISAAQVTEREIGVLNMPADLAVHAQDVVGQYALADFSPGDFVLTSKIAPILPSTEEKLLVLDGTRIALSVTLKTFAAGLSNKIAPGDIVSCLITTEQGTSIPPELTYVEVLAVTTASGADKQRPGDYVEGNLETATLLVTPLQAQLLANAEEKNSLHLALVHRGDSVDQYLLAQSELMDKIQENESKKGEPSYGEAVPSDGE